MGRVADDQQVLHVTRGAPAEMLHPGLVVNHHIGVVLADPIDHIAPVVIDCAVATLPFSAPHGNQIEAGAFCK